MFRTKDMAEVLAESSWVMVAKPETPVMVAKPDGTVEAPAIIHDEGAGPQEEPNEGGNGGGNDGGNGAGNGEEDGGNGGGNGGNDGDGGEDPDPPAEEDKDEHQEEEEEEEKEKEPELTEEEKAQKAKDLEEWHEKELANEKEREDKEREAKEAEESLQALLNDIDADKQDEAMKAAQDAAKDPIGQLPNFAAPDLPAHLDKEAEKQDVMNVKEEEEESEEEGVGPLLDLRWCNKCGARSYLRQGLCVDLQRSLYYLTQANAGQKLTQRGQASEGRNWTAQEFEKGMRNVVESRILATELQSQIQEVEQLEGKPFKFMVPQSKKMPRPSMASGSKEPIIIVDLETQETTEHVEDPKEPEEAAKMAGVDEEELKDASFRVRNKGRKRVMSLAKRIAEKKAKGEWQGPNNPIPQSILGAFPKNVQELPWNEGPQGWGRKAMPWWDNTHKKKVREPMKLLSIKL